MPIDETAASALLLDATAAIVCAHLGRSPVNPDALPELLRSVHGALARLDQPAISATAGRPEPAVSIRASVKPDHIVCLEDGRKLKMMKRYLATRFGMTPDQYRARWGLPADYPMVAPNYSEQRRGLAKSIGLGHMRGK